MREDWPRKANAMATPLSNSPPPTATAGRRGAAGPRHRVRTVRMVPKWDLMDNRLKVVLVKFDF